MERRIVGLAVFILLLLAACSGQPTPLTGDAYPDLSDPDVGGGVGIVLPGETPAPLPTISLPTAPVPTTTREVAPRATAVGVPVLVTATDTPPTTLPDSSPTEVADTPTAEPEVSAAAETDPAPAEPEQAAEDRPTTHVVVAGENLYRIGLQYGISYIVLAEFNGISNVDQVNVGQELQIPPAEAAADGAVEDTPEAEPQPIATVTVTPTLAVPTEAAAETTATPEPAAEATVSATRTAERVHTVQPGENLYRISQRYGVNWALIAEANGLISPNQLTVGQVLKIPTDAPGPDPQFTHQVHGGESLFRIALQYGVPLAVLVEANSLQAPFVIYPGQILVIPDQPN